MTIITIYCHTSPSGKKYVGQSVHGMLARWQTHVRSARSGSLYPLHRAIVKYGVESFEHVVLETVVGTEAANVAEARWIVDLDCLVPRGYNFNKGGNQFNTHPDTRKRISDASRAAHARKSPEERRQLALKRMSALTWEQKSAAAKKAQATIGPERRSEIRRKVHASRTPEQESEIGRKANAALTPAQRSDRSRRIMAALGPERRHQIALQRQAAFTPEQRRLRQIRAAASMTAEEKSVRARKVQAAISPARRKQIAILRMAARTAESKRAALRKGWTTRRAKQVALSRYALLEEIIESLGRVTTVELSARAGISRGKVAIAVHRLVKLGRAVRIARGVYAKIEEQP